jgi:hypothetical protein
MIMRENYKKESTVENSKQLLLDPDHKIPMTPPLNQ